jgi:hypothetical protein
MCQPDSPHPACPRAAVVVAAEAAIVAVAAAVAIAAEEPVTGVLAHDRAAVAEVIRVAGFNADRVAKYFPQKLRASFCCVRSNPLWCATLSVLFGDCLDCQTGPTGHIYTERETIRSRYKPAPSSEGPSASVC